MVSISDLLLNKVENPLLPVPDDWLHFYQVEVQKQICFCERTGRKFFPNQKSHKCKKEFDCLGEKTSQRLKLGCKNLEEPLAATVYLAQGVAMYHWNNTDSMRIPSMVQVCTVCWKLSVRQCHTHLRKSPTNTLGSQ
jgi:hypothetical protein